MATQTAVPLPLTKRLKAGGRELHTLSDALVNARLVALFADRQLYGKALGSFYLVHKELDAYLQKSSDDAIRKMKSVLQPMYRTAAMEEDLRYYLGPSWEAQVAATPPIQAYRSHLAQLAERQPQLLLAHSYTQHLALLAGGQIIKGLARKGMRLPEGQGTAAFDYTGKVGDIRGAYFRALDALGEDMDEETRQQMVEEHRQAFRFNNSIIKGFSMGVLAPLRAALLLLLPGAVWAALAAVAAAGLVAGALALAGRADVLGGGPE